MTFIPSARSILLIEDYSLTQGPSGTVYITKGDRMSRPLSLFDIAELLLLRPAPAPTPYGMAAWRDYVKGYLP